MLLRLLTLHALALPDVQPTTRGQGGAGGTYDDNAGDLDEHAALAEAGHRVDSGGLVLDVLEGEVLFAWRQSAWAFRPWCNGPRGQGCIERALGYSSPPRAQCPSQNKAHLQLVHNRRNTKNRCRLVGEHARIAVQRGEALAVCVEGLVVERHELVRDLLEVGSHLCLCLGGSVLFFLELFGSWELGVGGAEEPGAQASKWWWREEVGRGLRGGGRTCW